jgi:hypothetical protein
MINEFILASTGHTVHRSALTSRFVGEHEYIPLFLPCLRREGPGFHLQYVRRDKIRLKENPR